MAEHVLQFNDDGPDWCINCGEFAHQLSPECAGGNGEFDCRKPENRIRMLTDLFGVEVARNA